MSNQLGLTAQIRQIFKKQKLVYVVYDFFRQKAIKRRIEAQAYIPQVNLKQENIDNLKTITNREELIRRLPQNKVIAEIGVNRGEFSERLLALAAPQKLHLVDSWAGGRYSDDLKSMVAGKFTKEISEGKVEMNVGNSTDVLKTFPDEYFDWVFLDTDHSYLLTKAELEILQFKVKKDGIISGHDYAYGEWFARKKYGVVEAVNEFCVKQNWELIYLTSETDEHHSFAIRRIGV